MTVSVVPAMTVSVAHGATCGERGAGMGGYPGPALSVRLSAGHALSTVKSQIPELLSEGGSESRSRLTVTVRARGFVAVARMWLAGKRRLKMLRVVGCKRAQLLPHAARSSGPDPSEAS